MVTTRTPNETHGSNAWVESVRERNDILDQTIAVWQPRARRQLTREDAREIVTNIVGFFAILQEWDRAERGVIASSTQPAAVEADGAPGIPSDSSGIHFTRAPIATESAGE